VTLSPSLSQSAISATLGPKGGLTLRFWVKLGAWPGRFLAQLHEDDFSPFGEKLEERHTTLKGNATLSSLYGYLDL
jgi:hypothetical protein